MRAGSIQNLDFPLLVCTLGSLAVGVAMVYSATNGDREYAVRQAAFGLICGGILGNLIDRVWAKHVIDFLYFYIQPRGGTEIGFPAFNVADSAICTGVGLVFLLTLRSERSVKAAESVSQK